MRATRRESTICIPHSKKDACLSDIDNLCHSTARHCLVDFDEDECRITEDRLALVRNAKNSPADRCALSDRERYTLQHEQDVIRETLYSPSNANSTAASMREAAIDEERLMNEEASGGNIPQDTGASEDGKLTDFGFQLKIAKIRSRLVSENDGVLGIQARSSFRRLGSLRELVPRRRSSHARDPDVHVQDVSYVRKPDMTKIVEEYDRLKNHPKYTLRQVVLSRRFQLYIHRFANAQFSRTLLHPTLPQPKDLYVPPHMLCQPCSEVTEKKRTRRSGHRFILAADTQFGILMDGFAMERPSWRKEIEISRRCVARINDMRGPDRPLFVVVCGDLVDTESSFSGAIASWKKIMTGWERSLIFDQQVRDFKRVWAGLAPDIALVCLCGNHDVGNRPTRASISHWTQSFGDDYLSFWANGSFNICLNNCLFSNPSGAPDLFDEQLHWLEQRLRYARDNDATHIFVYGHFPWFLRHEEEADDELESYSAAPEGWGPEGSSFADSYFTIPYEYRKLAMGMFRKYDVTACFSGHFHQNVVAQSTWGMPMIVTGPLSMVLESGISDELRNGETNGVGMRIVDVGEPGQFEHKWTLLDEDEPFYDEELSGLRERNDPVASQGRD